MSWPAVPVDSDPRREPKMKEAAAIWHFVRHDRMGRWFGIAWAVVAWFALTWLSLTVLVMLLVVSVTLFFVQRRRRDLEPVTDELDDLF
jgi:Flp pilus assembly protein TadB